MMKKNHFLLAPKINSILAFCALICLSSCDLTFVEMWNTPRYAQANSKFVTGCTITNSWNSIYNPDGVSVSFYLSRDEYVSADDRLLKKESVKGQIAFLEKRTIITEIELPADLVNGDYFFLFSLNGYEPYALKINNTVAKYISISGGKNNEGSDLMAAYRETNQFELPNSVAYSVAVSGGNFPLKYMVMNIGNQAVPGTKIRFFLSSYNSPQTSTSYFLGEDYVPDINANTANAIKDKTLMLPPYLQEGLYTIDMKADAENTIYETNEVNNNQSRTVYVLRNPPTLAALPENSDPVALAALLGEKYVAEERTRMEQEKKATPERSVPDLSMKLGANPTANETTVSFQLPADAQIGLSIYDTKGNLIETLANARRERGAYTEQIQTGHLPPGTYFVVLNANGVVAHQTLVVQ